MADDWFVRAASVGESVQLADRGDPLFLVNMPEEVYHARPELSASGMKVLLQSPKHFQQSRRVRVVKPEWDEGHAVHSLVLGVGQPIAQIPQSLLSADNGIRSAAAKAWVENVRAEGKIPLKPEVYERITHAAEQVLRNPKARRLFEAEGHAEISMFGIDPATGLPLRGRTDWICELPHGWVIGDVKTTTDLSTHKLMRVVDDYGYDLQGETYRFLFELRTGLLARPVVLIFCEKTPPYDVRVVQLDGDWIDGGWMKMRRAIDRFRSSMDSGTWPGVDEDDGPIEALPTSSWYRSQLAGADDLEGSE